MLADLDAGDDDVFYNEPGRMAGLGGAKAPAFLVFASDPLPATRDDIDMQKQQVMNAYAGGRWRIPELMAKNPRRRGVLPRFDQPGQHRPLRRRPRRPGR